MADAAAVIRRQRGRPKAAEDKTEQNTVQSLDRAIGLLKLLAEAPGMTLSELAAASDQAAATVYRALVTLQGHGIVEIEEPGQLWHVGPGAFRIGSAFLRRSDVAERARGPMAELMQATGETVALAVETEAGVLYVAQVETRQPIRAFFPPGAQGPLHASAAGKALLAWNDEDRVRERLAQLGQPKFTSLTITSESTLLRELSRSRDKGFAVEDQEGAEGMRGVAAPIFDSAGAPVAALSVSGPAFRLSLTDVTRFGQAVREAADRVTAATGGAVG